MGRPMPRIRLEQRFDGADQCGRGARSDVLKSLAVTVARVIERLEVVTAVERTETGKAFVKEHAEREQIRASAAVPTERVLGRHVRDLPLERIALHTRRVIHRLGDAKIRELHLAPIAQQYVGRRDVAVDDALRFAFVGSRVREVEGRSQRVRDVGDEACVEPLVADAEVAKHCAKVASFDELEREIVCVIGHAEIEHTSDVPVVEQGGQPGFAQEHVDELRVSCERGQDAFEANALLETADAAAHGDEGLGHPADTQALDQLVVAKAFRGREGHERSKIAQRDALPSGALPWPLRAGRAAGGA